MREGGEDPRVGSEKKAGLCTSLDPKPMVPTSPRSLFSYPKIRAQAF